jgi:hypothetical protein
MTLFNKFNLSESKRNLDSMLLALHRGAGIGYSSALGRSGQRGAHRIPARACA